MPVNDANPTPSVKALFKECTRLRCELSDARRALQKNNYAVAMAHDVLEAWDQRKDELSSLVTEQRETIERHEATIKQMGTLLAPVNDLRREIGALSDDMEQMWVVR